MGFLMLYRQEEFARMQHAAHPGMPSACAMLFVVMLLSGCGGSPWLEHAVLPGAADWTQEGGNAQRSNVHARLPGAGNAEWEFSLDAMGGPAAALLRGETVFFPSVTMMVDAASLRDADLVGEFPTDGVNSSTPAILGENLFIATVSSVSRLHCFSLADGALRWQRTIDAVESALCAHDDAVFAASRDGLVYRFTARDSTEEWRVDLDVRVRAAPAAADSVLVVATAAGDVHGLSVRSGKALWRVPTFAAIEAAPVIVGRRVVAVNRKGRVVAVDLHQGTVLWEQPLDAPVYYSPAAQPRRLVFPLASGTLVMLDPEEGLPLGSIECGELPGASPQVAGDIAYQLLRKGILLRVDLRHGTHETIATLPRRSETPVLLTPRGIILVDEDGEAVMAGAAPAQGTSHEDRIK
jgi:hypothetical protein